MNERPPLPDSITLRPAEKSDRDFLFTLFKETAPSGLAAIDLPNDQLDALLKQQFEMREAQWRRANPDAVWSIIVDSDTPIGEFIRGETAAGLKLIDLALREGSRGRGIASALVRQLFYDAGKVGKPVRAHVHRDNPAREIWLHLGFEVVEDLETYYRLEFTPPIPLSDSLPDGYALRFAQAQDREFLFSLFEDARSRTFAAINLPGSQLDALISQQFESFHAQAELQYPSADHYLIIHRGVAIGEWHVDEDDERIYIVNAALLTEFQGKGISAALHRSLFARADRDGKPVRSHVEKGNPAQEILAHLGLKVVGDSGAYLELEYSGCSTK